MALFEVGERVRMTSSRCIYNPFEKGYVLKWTRELFVVRKCVPTTPPTYELSDQMGEPIKDKFYAQELQSVSPPESYRIEKIIASFLIVIVSLLNLSLSDRDKALWLTLVGASFGYLVPNPRFKRVGSGGGNNNDESISESTARWTSTRTTRCRNGRRN